MKTLNCSITAIEEDSSGMSHNCHTDSLGLNRAFRPKELINGILETTPVYSPHNKWKLTSCMPANHDGKGCQNCKYKSYRVKTN